LVAALARRSGDLALAEDALSEALVEALQHWPRSGPPANPEGWLYAVARRKLVGHWRKAEVRRRKARALEQLQALSVDEEGRTTYGDERLPLLFGCAHPGIDPSVRAPLMLQAVLGLTAEELGPMMGVTPKAMGQRLWRAKTKIRDAGIRFATPEGDEWEPRAAAVLDAVYGLYGAGWSHEVRSPLASEALWLARVLTGLLPQLPEAWGLSALLHYAEARRPAGRVDGVFVPLDDQDPAQWDATAIEAADRALWRAQAAGSVGPFQLEAAIQSALVHGRRRGAVDHQAVVDLYEGLVRLAPTLGVRVGQAAAYAELHGPAAGLEVLDRITGADRFQPWWAVRAALLSRLGRAEASQAYAQALALTRDPATAAFLERARARAERDPVR
jgi:RNA polymerase sigma-70 factor (ECF subfamily)